MDDLSKSYATITGLDAEVVAVSVDDLSGVAELVRQYGLPFPVLYTAGSPDVPRAYGVWALHEPGTAAASVFLIDKSGKLRWKYISSGLYDRAKASEIIVQLRKL
ncbi:MAG: redoxin domain-containing protein [Dehalococcoidia bacterium]|nr:redoxin domain-containing protein [Dehalococcoidia bacterium]MSQ34778.1 redoxin domain-containing protein [Dehalococcoidia bacterium]